MKKLFIAALIGLLIFTACDEDTNEIGNETEIIMPLPSQDNMVSITDINVSSIKIKDLNADQEAMLIKDGIVREFLSFLACLEYEKIDDTPKILYEAEILDTGDTVLKIGCGDYSICFSENIKIGNTVLEKGSYEVNKYLRLNLQHFFDGIVIDPQHIVAPSTIFMPEYMYSVDMIDRGSSKINRYEIFTKLYHFAEENFLGQKFEIVQAENINSYELMEQEKQNAMKNSRALIFETSENYIKVDSDLGYNQLIFAPNSFVVAENLEKPGVYKLYAESVIIDFKADDRFIKGFEDVFNENAREPKSLAPEEIEALINERAPYYMDYICKNLNIESWRGNEHNILKKHKMILNNQEEPYTVLEISDKYNLRLLFFKEDKFIDYIDYGHRFAGTEYRLEKSGDKVFIVGRRCREHGTGIEGNYEEWYSLSENGKKLVMGFPSLYYNQQDLGHWGYELTADNVQFNAGGDMSVTVDYNIRKYYELYIDIANEFGYVNVEGRKKVIFKWDEEREVFVSEYPQNEMGMFEIPPESDEITEKCTELLKSKYQQLHQFISSSVESNEFSVKHIKDLFKDFLDSCRDCDEKYELLDIIGKIKE